MFDLSPCGDKLHVADKIPHLLGVCGVDSQLRNHIVDFVRQKGVVFVSSSQAHSETNERELCVLAEDVQCFEVCNHGGVAETRCIRCHEFMLVYTERGKKLWT